MRQILTLIFVLTCPLAEAQDILTLQECYDAADRNYPLVQQRDLIRQAREYTLENVARGSLPNITLGGQASYQSEVTQIPMEVPGVEPLSKDQYRVFGEVSQTIYHGGLVNQKKMVEEVNAKVEEGKLDVELYQIKGRINDVFFGILLMQEQIEQTRLARGDLEAGLRKIEAAISNGTDIQRSADAIKAELLKMDQNIIETESAMLAYRLILEKLINQPVAEKTVLQKPVFGEDTPDTSRPELNLLDIKKREIENRLAVVVAGKKPRVDLFLQGGYGRPGLNMLENEFGFYYLGGIRFTWRLSGYYTLKNEREVLRIASQGLDIQKETFLFNRGLVLGQHDAEIGSLRRLIEVDNEIIALRTRVRETASTQLDEGVITATDFIREVNAEDQAKQNRALHEVRLLSAQARYRFNAGQQSNNSENEKRN